MKKYAFFGGSFNPPTTAHKKCAVSIIEKLGFDKVFFVPVGDSYEKKDLISEKHRYKMLKILCENNINMEVLDIELNKNKEYKAIDIFKEISNIYIYSDIYFVMGADNFKNILNWKSSEELVSNYKYIILARGENDVEEIIKNNYILNKNKEKYVYLNNNEKSNISSSCVRKRIELGNLNKIEELIDEKVLEYIKKEGLYI